MVFICLCFSLLCLLIEFGIAIFTGYFTLLFSDIDMDIGAFIVSLPLRTALPASVLFMAMGRLLLWLQEAWIWKGIKLSGKQTQREHSTVCFIWMSFWSTVASRDTGFKSTVTSRRWVGAAQEAHDQCTAQGLSPGVVTGINHLVPWLCLWRCLCHTKRNQN